MKMRNNINANKLKNVMLFSALIIITTILFLPLLWLLSASLQGPGEIYKVPFNWIPHRFLFENYIRAWTIAKMGRPFFVSTVVASITIAAHLFLCTLSGYVLGKYRFKFKGIFVMLILATMMLPQELTYIPLYRLMASLNLIDNYIGISLPFFISGVGVFMMMKFSEYIPNELLEASKIDGCGNLKTFFSIGLPLMKPQITTLFILIFTFIWNEFAWARIAVISKEMQTLPIALTELSAFTGDATSTQVFVTDLLAGSVISMAPIIIAFFVFQKYFIEGVTKSGIKG